MDRPLLKVGNIPLTDLDILPRMHGTDDMDRDEGLMRYREAVRMFATKEELAGLRSLIDSTARRLDNLPTRQEHEMRWKFEDERNAASKITQDATASDIRDINQSRLPKWFIPTIAVLAPVVVVIIAHFWR